MCYVYHTTVSEAQLKTLGQALWQALNIDEADFQQHVSQITSLPDDLDAETFRLDTEAEQAQVLKALLPWIQQGWVTLETQYDGRFATFYRIS